MRKTALLLVIAVYGYAANAQLTLRPQAGFEIPRTKLRYNNQSFFKPECQSSGQLGLRADFQFKGGLAPFAGIVTHRPLVSYSFDNPETGMTSYKADEGDLQVQLQAGLQYSTKPISLSGKPSAAPAVFENVSPAESESPYYSSGCHRKKSMESKTTSPQKTMWTLRLQPSAGIGYVPSGKNDLETISSGPSPSYIYNAGNVKTEFISGLGFEFAKNQTRILTLSINYFKGLSNNETTFTTESAGKSVTTTLRSEVSGWNASIGVPIGFGKKSSSATPQKSYRKCSDSYKSKCGSYRRLS